MADGSGRRPVSRWCRRRSHREFSAQFSDRKNTKPASIRGGDWIAATGVPVMADTTADLVPFEALLESTNEGLYGVDLESRCTFLNRAGSRMLGFTRYEVL